MLQMLNGTAPLLEDLHYEEEIVGWEELESRVSLVDSGDGRSAPDVYMTVLGDNLPLTRVAAAQLGRITGVKPSIYRDFLRNEQLTASMVNCSLSHPDRGCSVNVARSETNVLGVYPTHKSYITLLAAKNLMGTAAGIWCAGAKMLDDGSFEVVVVSGQETDSVRPGVYMYYNGRPQFAAYYLLHDGSEVVGEAKAPRLKKGQDESFRSVESAIENCLNKAIEGCDPICALCNRSVANPERFLSRLALLHGFSARLAESSFAGVNGLLNGAPNQYELVGHVAKLGGGENRRYQQLSHFVAFHGASVCDKCGFSH